MLTLTAGANAPVDEVPVELAVTWPGARGAIDCSAYLLADTGRVRGDDDMIFYNQPADATGSVRLHLAPGVARLSVDLARVPASVARVAMCATIDGSDLTMREMAGLAATLEIDGARRVLFAPELVDAHRSLRILELYRHAGRWKLRAIGQGFADGLDKLAGAYGVNVAGDAPSAPPPSSPPPPPAPPSATSARWGLGAVGQGLSDGLNRLAGALGMDGVGASAPPPPTPVPDEPVIFESSRRQPPPPPKKANEEVLTASRPAIRWPVSTGPITATLAWSSRLGGTDGRPSALDLALGCHFALADGSPGVLQPGGRLATSDEPALLRLAPASVAGDGGRQALVLDGARLCELAEVTVYAVIPAGAPNWDGVTARLVVATPGRTAVAVPIERGEDGCAAVALARLSPAADGIEIARLARFAFREPELDATLGWGLAWR